MKKKILALSLLSFLATLASCGQSSPPKYQFDYTFDATKGQVTSSVAKGEHEEGTEITLTTTAISGYQFVGYYDTTSDTLISDESNYSFTLTKDTSLEAKFDKAETLYNFEYSFDEGKGSVTSSAEKGKVKEGTSITLEAKVKGEVAYFSGFYDKTSGRLLEKATTYTFTISKDTNIEARFSVFALPSDEELNVLKGTFNSELGTLVVTNNKVSLSGKELKFDLKYNEVKDEDINVNNGRILYFGEDNLYRLYLSDTEIKNPVLEQKVDGEYIELATFMPTIQEFSGSYYLPWQEGSNYDPTFTSITLSNEFDFDRELYLVNFSFSENKFNNLNSFFFKSGYIEVEGKLVKSIAQYDFADETNMGTFILGEKEGTKYLKGVGEFASNFMPCESPFHNSYWNEKETLNFVYDATKKTTTLNEKEYVVTTSFDDKGMLYTLTSGEIIRKFRADTFGLVELVNNEEVRYAFNGNEKYIEGEFTSGDYKVKVNLEGKKVTINEKEATFEYVLREKRKAIEVIIDDKTYTIFGFKDDTSENYVIRLTVDGTNHFLVNKELYKGHFVGTHVYKGFKQKEKIVIDNELNFTYNETTKKVELEYEVKSDSVYIEYLEGEKPYKFYLEDDALKAFVLSSETEEKIFLPEEQLNKFSGSYTTKIMPSLVFENDKAKLNGKEHDYRVDLIFEQKTFANYINLTINQGAINSTFIIDSLGTIAEYKGTALDGALNFTDTYIKTNDAESLVGRYSLDTKFGEENFEFKDDGTFYVDQLRGDGEALQENVKKEFTLSYSTYEGKAVPTINFVHGTTTIFVKKVGESLITFDNYYTKDYIYRFNGYYKDATNALRLYQNVLTLNGKTYEIESSVKEGTKTTITSGTSKFVFNTVEGKKVVDVTTSEFTGKLEFSTFDPTKLDGATLTVDGTKYIVKVTEDKTTGIKKVVLEGGFMPIEGKYAIYEGKEALQFSVMFDEYFAYLDGETPTLSKKAGLLPPPPPLPPAPPAPPLP